MSEFPELDAAGEARLKRASFFALAGLLHDAGKAIERSGVELGEVERGFLPANAAKEGDAALKHVALTAWILGRAKLAAKGIELADLKRVACSHHRPGEGRGDEHVLARANRVAGGGGAAAIDDSIRTVRSVLAGLDGRSPGAGDAAWLPSGVWDGSLESIQPKVQGEADRSASEARTSADTLVRSLSFEAARPDEAVERVQAVAQRLFGAVPASRRRGDAVDVSLLDHARAVAAIAACLSLEHADPPADEQKIRGRYRLIGVAVGGIQSFLFRTIPALDGLGGGGRGLAKVLRGRSFFVGLLAHLAARRILAEVGLPITNLLIEAGGRITLLVPDDAESARRAEAAIDRCRAWFLNTFAGSLRLDIAAVTGLGDDDLLPGKVPATMRRLADAMDAARLRLPSVALRSSGDTAAAWSEDGWILRSNGNPVDSGDLHDRIVAFGRAIPKGRALEIGTPSRTPRKGTAAIDLFGWRVAISSESDGDAHRLALELSAERLAEPTLMVANHVPRYRADDLPTEDEGVDGDEPRVGDPVTFDRLAGRSVDDDGRPIGGEMVAALKADVDRLGMLGSYGLGESASLARLAGFSRQLDQFFKCGLSDLIRREYPNVYTVYAGGDDLFLVGPWFDIVRLAARVRREFERLTARNPSVTISAGIAMARGTAPIRDLAAHADRSLDRAKDSGRDRITLFGASLDWKQYGAALDFARTLLKASFDEGLPSGFVYRLLQYGKSAQRLAEGQAREGDAGWRAHLNYDLRRNYPVRPDSSELRSGIHRELMSIRGPEAVRLKVAATLALYQLRGASLAAARGDES